MPMLKWGAVGERYFEAGVDRGVIYVDGQDGVAWTGLISVNEAPTGGDPKPYYLDGVKYNNRASREEYKASIEAYTYPPEFAPCDGTVELEGAQAQGLFISQQPRKPFHFSYRTKIGNDLEGIDKGYKIHIVYNALATPTNKSYKALGKSEDASTFSWDITTMSRVIQGSLTSAHLVIDTREAYPWAVAAIEQKLYGTVDTPAVMPTPDELIALFVDNALLKITDNGDGTWTAEGPDSIISMLDDHTFQINWPSAIMLDDHTYEVRSL